MGAESVPGTAVDATSIWRGIGTIQDNLETVFPQEDIGILPGTDRQYIPRVEALLSLENTEATYEQLPYLFQMGVANVTPTTDANGVGIFTYTMPIASSDINVSTDLGTYTWEGGDNQQRQNPGAGRNQEGCDRVTRVVGLRFLYSMHHVAAVPAIGRATGCSRMFQCSAAASRPRAIETHQMAS
jgi:hypothetical protein